MTWFIGEHHEGYGVEPICKVLPIAPSTYYMHAARRADPAKAPPRVQHDGVLHEAIGRVFEENRCVYGARQVWRQLANESIAAARCSMERLMRQMGLKGVVRGKGVRTTHRDKATPCPQYRVNPLFHAERPNALRVSDFTYVSRWRASSTWPS